MTKEEIKKAILEEIYNIAPDYEGEDIDENANIQEEVEIDSYDFLNLLTALYEKFGVEVPEEDYSKVDTLSKMVDYFYEHMNKK